MNKYQVLEHLDAARRSHIKWLNRAKSMVEGSSVVRDPHPLESTACQFGLWFHSEGKGLFAALQLDGEETTHALHKKLHDKYLKIYEIYFGSAEGIVYDQKAKLQKQPVTDEEDKKARKHMKQLRELSYAMLDEITQLEEVVRETDLFE